MGTSSSRPAPDFSLTGMNFSLRIVMPTTRTPWTVVGAPGSTALVPGAAVIRGVAEQAGHTTFQTTPERQ